MNISLPPACRYLFSTITKCLLFTTNEIKTLMELFSVELQKHSVRKYQNKFQGSRTFCAVRKEGDFSLYLHTQFMGLKAETLFNFSPLGLIFRALARSTSVCSALLCCPCTCIPGNYPCEIACPKGERLGRQLMPCSVFSQCVMWAPRQALLL